MPKGKLDGFKLLDLGIDVTETFPNWLCARGKLDGFKLLDLAIDVTETFPNWLCAKGKFDGFKLLDLGIEGRKHSWNHWHFLCVYKNV